jgi:hypothetical protein
VTRPGQARGSLAGTKAKLLTGCRLAGGSISFAAACLRLIHGKAEFYNLFVIEFETERLIIKRE